MARTFMIICSELRCMAFDPYEAFSVGETPGIGMQMGKLLTGEDRHELDMIFSFDHWRRRGICGSMSTAMI